MSSHNLKGKGAFSVPLEQFQKELLNVSITYKSSYWYYSFQTAH